MKYALVFGALAFALGWSASQNAFWLLRWLFWSGALCFGGVALAYAGIGPKMFLKSQVGRLTVLSWLLFWPYHALNLMSLRLFLRRQKQLGALVSPITSRVFLGPRLNAAEAKLLLENGNFAVLDLAAELPETSILRGVCHYLSLPVLDTCAPTFKDLQRGAQWLELRQKEGPIYVHCALGHGRSATYVAAFLMQTGQAADADAAIALIRQKRPGIGPESSAKTSFESASSLNRNNSTQSGAAFAF